MALKKSDLYSSLWSSADEMRGTVQLPQGEDARDPINAKTKAATSHFAAIGVGDCAVSSPANWRM